MRRVAHMRINLILNVERKVNESKSQNTNQIIWSQTRIKMFGEAHILIN